MPLLLLLIALLGFATSTAADETFGQNKVQYKTLDWYDFETEHFEVYFSKGNDSLGFTAADVLERSYRQLHEDLSYSVRKKVPVIIHASPNEFQQTNVIMENLDEGTGGFTEVFKNRVVIPYPGNYEDFRHVLAHELTHAVTFDMLYGGNIGSMLSRQALFIPPLWFAEGMAEFYSRRRDTEKEMVVRDGVINGYTRPFAYLGGFLAYKEGQAVFEYIADKYGRPKVGELLERARFAMSLEKALKSTLGKDEDELYDDWLKYERKRYWPEIARRDDIADIAKPMTDHMKDGSFMNMQPVFSPTGDRYAYYSNKDDYISLYIASAFDGKVICKLAESERSGHLESLHSFDSAPTWSPDGTRLAFVAKGAGQDKIYVMTVPDGDLVAEFNPDCDAMWSPDWSEDGKSIVAAALRRGKMALVVVDVPSGTHHFLLEDRYSIGSPAWSPDGQSIVFSSDRGAPPESLYWGPTDLYLLTPSTGALTRLTDEGSRAISPRFDPSGQRIVYVSDRNGIQNLYIHDLVSGESYPITNVLSGCYTPCFAPDSQRIIFSGFQKGGWDIFVKTGFRRLGTDSLEPTDYVRQAKFVRWGDLKEPPKPETTLVQSTTNWKKYRFDAGSANLDGRLGHTDTGAVLDTTVVSRAVEPYHPKFAPELATGALDISTLYGAAGQAVLTFSDVMGNHRITVAAQSYGAIDDTYLFLSYLYLAKRVDFGVALYHKRNYYLLNTYDGASWFADRLYGLNGLIAYPFSKYTRAELTLDFSLVDREYTLASTTIDAANFGQANTRGLVLSSNLINDNALWGMTGPVRGGRWMVSANASIPAMDNFLSFYGFRFDWRHYFYLGTGFSVALRGSGAASFGPDAQNMYLGGSENWLNLTARSSDLYRPQQLYFGRVAVPLRGFDLYQFRGTRVALMNVEFRYPFIERLSLGFPIPMTIGYINGALFGDFGAAWRDDKSLQPFRSSAGLFALHDAKGAFGFGSRMNIGFAVLGMDLAWSTDFAVVAPKPRWYFTLGAEF